MSIVKSIFENIESNGFVSRVSDLHTNTSVCLLDYADNFDWLWGVKQGEDAKVGFNEWLADRAGKDATVVISWEGMPASERHQDMYVIRHITPFDWALSISAELLSRAESLAQLRIIVIDNYSHSADFFGQGVFALDMLESLKTEMPWLRVMPPSACRSYLEEVANDDHGDFQCLRATGIDKRNQVLSLNGAWQSITARTGEAHSISNVVGPLLLLGDTAHSTPIVGALSRRMNSLSGVNEDRNGGSNKILTSRTSWIDWADSDWDEKLKRLGRHEAKLKLLVLDDQWRDGWGEVLCKAVGASYNPPEEKSSGQFIDIGVGGPNDRISVKSSDSADWLLLEDGPLKVGKDTRFKLSLDDTGGDFQEVLFLDLRLYSRRPIEEEVQYIERLVDIARQINMTDPSDLPWPCFGEDELDRVETWVRNTDGRRREDPPYHEALTLLPRIVSLLDPSYPIILFSSTGRREIVDRFKEYGSIITDFEKPRLTSVQASDVASKCASGFIAGFDRAMSMVLARTKCRGLMGFSMLPSVAKGSGPAPKHLYVELYIDETDNWNKKKFYVGGCFAVFPGKSAKKARDNADVFEDVLVSHGLRYFDGLGVGPAPRKIKRKKQHVNEEYAAGLGAPEGNGGLLLLGRVRISNDPYRSPEIAADVLDPRGLDNAYRLSVSALIELFLFESVPEISHRFGSEKIEVSVFVATRVKFLPASNEMQKAKSEEKRRTDELRFGIASKTGAKGNLIQYSVSRDGVYPLVCDAMTNHGKGVAVRRAVGVQLPYEGKGISHPQLFVCRKCGETTQISIFDINNGRRDAISKCRNCENNDTLRPDYRALHYLADEVLSNFPSSKNDGVYDAFFSNDRWSGQFDDHLNDDLQSLMQASRCLDRGDVVSAIVLVASMEKPRSVELSAYRLVSERLSSAVRSLDGPDFVRVSTQLPDKLISRPFYAASIQILKKKHYSKAIAILRDGPEKGKSVTITNRFEKLRRLVDGEELRIRYVQQPDGKLVAQELRLV